MPARPIASAESSEIAAVTGLNLSASSLGEYAALGKLAEGEELGSNLLRVDQRSCKQWSERTRVTSPDVGSRPMRAQPIACLSASESPSQIDASLPARLPGSDIYGMIQPSRHCAIVAYVLRQTARTLDRETLIATSLRA